MPLAGITLAQLANMYRTDPGFRSRLSDLMRDPAGFFKSAVQDVTPTPKELMSAFVDASSPTLNGSVMLQPEADAAKQKMMNLSLAGITAYHGSPYKFDKFDMSKVGTGEGAQAYGHGMYFAENKGTADYYAKAVSADTVVHPTFDGKPITSLVLDDVSKVGGEPAGMAAYAMQSSGTKDAARQWLKDVGNKPALKWFDENAERFGDQPPKNNLYKVDLPDDQIAKMLDWDKPLKEQPQSVKDVANKMFGPQLKTRKIGPDLVDVHLYEGGAGSIGAFPTAKVAQVLANPADYLPFTGSSFYKSISKRGQAPEEMTSMSGQKKTLLSEQYEPSQASADLKALGIPGIRYLDGGSRGKGQGTYNYVVFDSDIPKIVGRE